MIKDIVVILICAYLVSGQQHVYKPSDRIQCEPKLLRLTPNIWKSKYNFDVNSAGYLTSLIYKSNATRPSIPIGIMERASKLSAVHEIFHVLSIYQTATLFPPRKTTFLFLVHFLAGDEAVIHQFHPESKKYTETVLGFHTNIFFELIRPGTYYAVDIKQHANEKFALLGFSVVAAGLTESNYGYNSMEGMIEEFPRHKSIIEKLYTTTNTPP